MATWWPTATSMTRDYSTWVFEMDEATWRGHEFETFDETGSKARLEKISPKSCAVTRCF